MNDNNVMDYKRTQLNLQTYYITLQWLKMVTQQLN
jgi:hypothetical protein